MSGENELLIRINGSAKDFIAEIDKVKKKTAELEDGLKDVAKVSAVSFAALAASIAFVTKQYADYEKALVGVGKTTDINGKQLQDFGKQFQQMAARIPVATNELLGIAQAAGQLGVKGEANLLKFTETVAKLGVATDLSGTEAATSLTRILTVTGEGVESIDKFGSVIVALGNNFAATESEIVRVATEVSRSTAVFGVSASEAAALSAALKSLGVQAELGGSAVGRAYRAIDASIRSGGAAIERLSQVTGIAKTDLKKAFAEDSTAVFQKFIEGIGRVSAAGGDTTATLAQFKLKGEEILKVLPVLAQNSDLLGRALGMASKEMANATALNKEADTAFATLTSDTQRLQNVFTTLATSVGARLAPELGKLLQGTTKIIDSINSVDGVTVGAIASLLKFGLIISASVTAVASASIGYLAFNRVMAALKLAFDVSRLAVVGFTSAATLGLSVVLAFLPEIISGIGDLFAAFKEEKPADSIDDLAKKLKALKATKDAILAKPLDDGFVRNTDALDKEIAKVEELYNAKLKASGNFGDGSLLVRPKLDGGFDPLAGLQAQTIPFAAPENDATKKAEEQQAAELEIHAKGVEKKIAQAELENAKLAELQKLKLANATSEEIAFANTRIEIENERNQALQIADTELRDAEIVGNTLKNEALLEAEAAYYLKKQENAQLAADQKVELDAILRETDLATFAQFTAEDLAALQAKVATEDTVKKEAATAEVTRDIAKRKAFLENEIKYGTETAKAKQFFASEEVQLARDGASALVSLQNSKNKELATIGKAAASVQAAIATGEGAIKAYSALAGIPIIGPALGTAAAAAVIAYGAEQQANILGANEGGIVPMGGGRRGVDSVPAMLTPDELIVPAQNFDEVVDATAAARGGGGGTGGGNAGQINNFYGDFFGEETFIDKMGERLFDAQKNRNLQLIP